MSISFPLPTAATYDFSLEPLFAPIDPTASKSSIMATKIELVLKKTTAGQKWPSLEGTVSGGASGVANAMASSTSATEPGIPNISKPSTDKPSAPAYPTSSRSGPKDWDKVAADLTKKPKKTTTGAEGDRGDDDGVDEDEDGDPVDGFFKKLYAGADPDTRRAMMKSYQESNGTALSTNWSEVGKGKVETSPPEGMEAKSWDK